MARDRYLPRIAIGFICLALVSVSTTAMVGWWQSRSAALKPAYALGETLDVPPSLYAGAEQTLVIFVRESCSVCRAEADGLAKIAATLKELPSPLPTVVVTGSNDVEADSAFARSFGQIRHEHVAFSRLKLQVVPTIVLVDRQGTVLYAREGRSKTTDVIGELMRRIPGR